MRLQRLDALPFLDHDECVRPAFRLKAAEPLRVHRRAVLDAALLGMNGRHVGPELIEDRFAQAGLCGDEGEDVDHLWRSGSVKLASGGSLCSAKLRSMRRGCLPGEAPPFRTGSGLACSRAASGPT